MGKPTHRRDYFDIRAMSYIDVIAEILRLAGRGENKKVKRSLSRHALAEARHFWGYTETVFRINQA
ncbi:UNVERIFIED_ORG: hypothetical protein M2414_005265 [Rahnella aquatilis]